MSAARPDRRAFATRFSQLRRRLGYSRVQVGRSLGMSASVAYYWEAGKSFPTPEAMQKLANLFGVTESYLATGDKTGTIENKAQDETLLEAIASARQKIAGLAGVELENVSLVVNWTD